MPGVPYLTIGKAQKYKMATNYWKTTLAFIPICPKTEELKEDIKFSSSNQGKKVVAAPNKCGGFNHSKKDKSIIAQR